MTAFTIRIAPIAIASSSSPTAMHRTVVASSSRALSCAPSTSARRQPKLRRGVGARPASILDGLLRLIDFFPGRS